MRASPFPMRSYCLCGDQAMFLDVGADRYFTLPGARNRDFVQALSGESTVPVSQSAAITDLLATFVRCQVIAAPTDTLTPRARTRVRSTALIRAAIAYAITQSRLKRRGLAASLVSSAQYGVRPSAPLSTPFANQARKTYVGLATAFDALAPICGRAENCLPRSIAFHRLAKAAGLAPLLVIGVKRDPFAAHCWVQDGATILNDSVEHVRIYTPILVI